MNFRKFFSDHTFNFLQAGKFNWDYYTMAYKGGQPIVVALAKNPESSDCIFGSMDYFQKKQCENCL